MKTLYIDVYFLINFTIDILALFFSVRLCHVRTRVTRLVLCSVIGAISAIIDVFLGERIWIRILSSVITLILIAFLVAPRITLRRRIKLIGMFFMFMLLLCGLVYLGYSILERFFEAGMDVSAGSENRRALIFSTIILISIGIIKVILMIFSDMFSDKSVKLVIEIGDNCVETEALIDSGNLVKDPMNMSPVIFIKPSLALRLLPKSVCELSDIDSLDEAFKKRIRLIPITRTGETHVLTGIRPDCITAIQGHTREELDLTIAIDKEEGTYGGYEALAPYAAIKDVI